MATMDEGDDKLTTILHDAQAEAGKVEGHMGAVRAALCTIEREVDDVRAVARSDRDRATEARADRDLLATENARLRARITAAEALLAGMAHDAERALAARTQRGGQHAPYTGGYAAATPSVATQLARDVAEVRAILASDGAEAKR